MVLLNHRNELEGVKDGIKKSENAVKVKTICANNKNFNDCFTENPVGLHFSGHGYPNEEKQMGPNNYAITKGGGGYCLMLESDHQTALFKTENQLRDLVITSDKSLQFVFLASCHSEAFGKIFSNVGIPHVICID